MAYRNGTYIAFHAEGKTDPTASDIRYYRMLKAWHRHDDIDFRFVNSHDKVAAVRDTSSRQTIQRSLRQRLDNSKNMVLIIGDATRRDTDFVPYEIAYAVDTCGLPIIAAYTGYDWVLRPSVLRPLWPAALASRIDDGSARVLHIGFRQSLIDAAIREFDVLNVPGGSLTYYTQAHQQRLGISFAR